MTDYTQLVDRYFDTWNEPDVTRRRALIAAVWTEDGDYADPVQAASGRDGIDAMIRSVQEHYPGCRFRRTGHVDAHSDRLRFTWELGAEAGPTVAAGTDFATVSGGLLRSITGFFDSVAATPADRLKEVAG